MEANKVSQHRARLIERTVAIVLAHPVLLQEVVFEHPRNFQRDLVIFSESALSDKLYNLSEIFFFLEDFLGLCPELDETRLGGFVIGFENFGVFRIRERPVDGREMFALGEFLVQTPENLYDTKSSGCDRIRKVSARW